MLRPGMDAYNDGVVALMAPTPARGVIGADFSTDVGLEQVGRLAYKSLGLRAQDVQLATAEGFELSRKIRTRRAPSITPSILCCTAGKLYEVAYVDTDATSHYLYLNELATDGTAKLLAKSVTYDAHHVAHDAWDGPTVHVRKASTALLSRFAAMSQSLNPTATLVIRACDYGGQEKVSRDGIGYDVVSSVGEGEWVRLACERGAA